MNKVILTIMLGLILSTVQSAEIHDKCEKLRQEISPTDSPGLYVTYSEFEEKRIDDVYFVNLFGRQLPLPKEKYSEVAFISRNGKPHIVALRTEEDAVRVSFVIDSDYVSLIDTQNLFQMSFFELLDYGFSITPDNLKCSGSVTEVNKNFTALAMKGLLFSLYENTKVYKKDWGWLVENSFENHPNQTTIKLIVSESVQVDIKYDTDKNRRHIGHMFDHNLKELPENSPPSELINLSACLTAQSLDCLNNLEGLKVREIEY
jgi:hypothetical protein